MHENLSVDKLAFQVQLTPAKLQMCFKSLPQKMANNYIKERRLQAAYDYLSHTKAMTLHE